MKRQTIKQKERGVALLLILGLMAMFAMMVLAFMIITSNMAETARLNADLNRIVPPSTKNDLDTALRTLMIGTDNRQCPIGPFSILENLYGDYRNPSNRNDTYTYLALVRPSEGLSLYDPSSPASTSERFLLVYPAFASINEAWIRYQEAGSILTFGDAPITTLSSGYLDTAFEENSMTLRQPISNPDLWNSIVQGTSAPILSKFFHSPNTSDSFTNNFIPANKGAWGFKVAVPESIYQYIQQIRSEGNYFTNPFIVNIRFNLPQYSGTGAGYFIPDNSFHGTDNQLYSGDSDALNSNKHYLFHLYDWANASAPDPKPDTIPVTGESTAQTFWCHLYNALFKDPPDPPELLRMNPSYTAPDNRNLFLAWYPTGIGPKSPNNMIPSFHRIYKFYHADDASKAWPTFLYQDNPGDPDTSQLIFGLDLDKLNALDSVRKMIPRPLPLDHWNFFGGNEEIKLTKLYPDADSDKLNFINTFNSKLNEYAQILCQHLTWEHLLSLDVDNDNDGLKEGIWIPSGLPIRTAADGTPYFTMFSYTVVDMDGKVNINTAGNWDQLPARRSGSLTMPYHNMSDLIGNWTSAEPADNSDHLIFYSEKLSDKIGWWDDMENDLSSSDPVRRGTGYGTSGIQLYYALKAMGQTMSDAGLSKLGYLDIVSPGNRIDCASILATNLIWRRNSNLSTNNLPNTSSDLVWSKDTVFPQPGNTNTSLSEKEQHFIELYNPVVKENNGDQRDYIFPWRGKLRIPYGQDRRIPPFNFTDSALISYDRLGHSIFTYSPMFSDNPYFLPPLNHSLYDSTYSAASLEAFLRSRDGDFGSLPKTLLYDLFDLDHYAKTHTSSEVESVLNNKDAKTVLEKLTDTITTNSTDIPVASTIFPDKIHAGEFNGAGAYGITALIKKCVRTEFMKSSFQMDLTDPLKTDIEVKVNDVTRYLVSLLPDEILAGHKLNLNMLSSKTYWLDLVKNGPGYQKGDLNTHNIGLAKKMEFARGLYILIMALTYQDRNASLDNEAPTPYTDYIEGGQSENITDLLTAIGMNSADRSLLNQELIANRIAQWCVNLIDFSDPDATMTPFFYDPNPFDGWWIKDTSLAGCGKSNPGTSPPLTPLFNGYADSANKKYVNPREHITEFFQNLLNTPDAERTDHMLLPGISDDPNKQLTFATAVAWWLQSKREDPSASSRDLGFRLVWGMERPDLLLTETLNWHDLGIANTKYSTADKGRTSGSNTEKTQIPDRYGDYDKNDPHFDQVKRPRGVSFLELYCTANPNIPQSEELYVYDYIRDLGSNKRTDLPKQWQLNLAKTTPAVPVREKSGSNTRDIKFPVWRITITDSAVWGKGTNYSNAEKQYKKKWNSILYHLAEESEKTDYQTFSFQTKQFRDFPENWKDFKDISVSSILGPTYAMPDQSGVSVDMIPERYIWLGGGFEGNRNNRTQFFPDATRIFAPLEETWTTDSIGIITSGYSTNLLLSPNQYLIVGPSREEAIGSISQSSGTIPGIGGLLGARNYCQPSTNTISIRNYEYSVTGIGSLQIETVKTESSNPKVAMNSKFILAGSVMGDDSDKDMYFNISEPLWENTTDPYGSVDFESQKFRSNQEASKYPYPDIPYDLPEGGDWGGNAQASDHTPERPIAKDRLFGIGMVPGYKSACLQRVADPNRPYHPIMNPYITIDWNMMDLTVFNGTAQNDGNYAKNNTDEFRLENYQHPENKKAFCIKYLTESNHDSADVQSWLEFDSGFVPDASKVGTNVQIPLFSSRQWGRKSQKGFCPEHFSPKYNPFSRAFDYGEINNYSSNKGFGLDIIKTAKKANDEDYDLTKNSELNALKPLVFPARPWNTLGVFNNLKKAANPPNDRENENMNGVDQISNSTYSFGDVYWRGPAVPMEHLVWNDAPFSNPMEISLVPASAPGRFGLEFVHKIPTVTSSNVKEYNLAFLFHQPVNGSSLGSAVIDNGQFGSDPKGKNNDPKRRIGPYFNFFHSSSIPGQSLNLAQLLDFVHVPSPYASVWDYAGEDENYGSFFHTKLRDPGKININTATQNAWAALIGDDPYSYSGVTPDISLEPHRSNLPFQPVNAGILNSFKMTGILPGDFSLLRRWPLMTDDSLESTSTDPTNPDLVPLFGRERKGNLRAATETLQRLSGLSTNRSNVFAIWITVGYFEAERCKPGENMPRRDFDGNDLRSIPSDENSMPIFITNPGYTHKDYYRAIYPDGYTYGKELGLETGEVKRHRGFYMIDRSIPVDFRRGQSWNWKNTILLERQID